MLDLRNFYEFLPKIPDGEGTNTQKVKNSNIIENLNQHEQQDKEETVVSSKETSPFKKTASYKVQCSHCEQIFTEDDFRNHICEYEERKIPNSLVTSNDIFNEMDCLRLLNENQLQLSGFLKNDLKYTLKKTLSHKKRGPNRCSMCDRKFVYATGLSRHMSTHFKELLPSIDQNVQTNSSPQVLIKCTICCRVFYELDEAQCHLFNHHFSIKPILENELDDPIIALEESPPVESLLNISINIYNQEVSKNNSNPKKEQYLNCFISNSVLQCEFCDFLFTEVFHLLNHSQYHKPSFGFQCLSCEISFQTSRESFNHWQVGCVFVKERTIKNLILPTYFVCNVCKEKFILIDLLHTHRYEKNHFFPRLNGPELAIACEYCGDIFNTMASLVDHNLKNHQYQKYNSESKFRRYLCEICGKTYTQSSHLLQHLKYHQGIKPYACKMIGCSRRFAIRRELSDHLHKSHTGQRPWHCLTCGKRFLTGSVYYQHRLIHRRIRRFGCDHCSKRFYRADALRNHRRIHTGEKPFVCLHCPKMFRQQGDCFKHMRTRHGLLNKLNLNESLKNNADDDFFESPDESLPYENINYLSDPITIEIDPAPEN